MVIVQRRQLEYTNVYRLCDINNLVILIIIQHLQGNSKQYLSVLLFSRYEWCLSDVCDTYAGFEKMSCELHACSILAENEADACWEYLRELDDKRHMPQQPKTVDYLRWFNPLLSELEEYMVYVQWSITNSFPLLGPEGLLDYIHELGDQQLINEAEELLDFLWEWYENPSKQETEEPITIIGYPFEWVYEGSSDQQNQEKEIRWTESKAY